MYNYLHYWGFNNFTNFHPGPILGLLFWLIAIPVFIAVLILKGVALWIAARKGHKGWFVALLVINTFGILELLYIFHFSKRK